MINNNDMKKKDQKLFYEIMLILYDRFYLFLDKDSQNKLNNLIDALKNT